MDQVHREGKPSLLFYYTILILYSFLKDNAVLRYRTSSCVCLNPRNYHLSYLRTVTCQFVIQVLHFKHETYTVCLRQCQSIALYVVVVEVNSEIG